jgi:hypothetical protein
MSPPDQDRSVLAWAGLLAVVAFPLAVIAWRGEGPYPAWCVACLLAAVAVLAARRLLLHRRHEAWVRQAADHVRAGLPPPPQPPLGLGWLAVALAFVLAALILAVLWLIDLAG